MENTDCNLSQLLSKAAITEAPAGGDAQTNAPAKYQPDPSKIPTGSKLPSRIVQFDEMIDFSFLRSKTPDYLFPARSGAKTQPNVKIGSSSNHDVWETDEDDDEDEDEDLDLSQLLARGPFKGYLVPEAHVPAYLARKSQPNWPEKYESQIKLPSSSNPPPQTVNKDDEDNEESDEDDGGKVSGFSGLGALSLQ